MFWYATFYVLVVIVASGLGFLTGNWKHFQIVAAGGPVLLVAWWGISTLLRGSQRR
jgi:hypothetical protein